MSIAKSTGGFESLIDLGSGCNVTVGAGASSQVQMHRFDRSRLAGMTLPVVA
jgi:hypothetical protein